MDMEKFHGSEIWSERFRKKSENKKQGLRKLENIENREQGL
jgi:hypothetical protein